MNHQIHEKLRSESYTPRSWRTLPLHICPLEPYNPTEPSNKAILNWIFLISALNFSFWSEKEGQSDRYGVEWQKGWDNDEKAVYTGYWSLVASLDRGRYFHHLVIIRSDFSLLALQDDSIPITDPNFYSSETLCPDSLIESVFRPAAHCSETIPLLRERIAIMREVGFILCNVRGISHSARL